MKKKDSIYTLRDAISDYGDYKGFVFIHKYGTTGDFKYQTSEIGDKLLSSEIMIVRKHTGGKECEYNAVTYIIR